MSFLVDTGASTTSLHPTDATVGLHISRAALRSPERWPEVVQAGGIGGSAMYYRTAARYGFVHEDGVFQVITGVIDVARLTPTNGGLPSLLGWNTLQHFRITIDWSARDVLLDRIS